LNQFVTPQITALLTIQSYMSFVIVYMLGSALLFQVPLVLIFINRIKPLKPQKLFKYERWVIASAFILSALLNPSPHLADLLLLAAPMIIMYQVGILIVWRINRKPLPKHFANLVEQDAAIRAARQQRSQITRPVFASGTEPLQKSVAMRPRSYVDDFGRRRAYQSLRASRTEGSA
jgi:sec-independent protein translocase protein TatC